MIYFIKRVTKYITFMAKIGMSHNGGSLVSPTSNIAKIKVNIDGKYVSNIDLNILIKILFT